GLPNEWFEMHDDIRNIFVFSLQLFTDPVSDKMCILKLQIRLYKQMHIDPDIPHTPASSDLMAALYPFNAQNKVTNFFFFNSGHIHKSHRALLNNPVSSPEDQKSYYYSS